tara:strand:- start:3180 stop:4523 length:1344 start_codon:yes stop_codon:yes gene_type:complete
MQFNSTIFNKTTFALSAAVACLLYVGYELNRENFYALLGCFTILFSAYYFLVKNAKGESLNQLLVITALFRLFFLFSIPTLSDDYFRFIWDGQLLANGINPFDYLPSEVHIDFPNKAELLAGMNSPNYYTVYPPITQTVYFLSAWLSPNSIFGSILVMRSIIIAAEIGIIVLLPKLLRLININPVNSLWYALNPLVIIELTGNLHFEGIVLFFFLLAVYLLALNKEKLSAVAWAFAAATKLIPIFFLPIILRRLSIKKAIAFYFFFGVTFIALWIPFYNSTLLPHFLESVSLYSKTFEFNASVYYLVRAIGYQVTDYNIIQTAGPWLARIAYVGILAILLKKKIISWQGFFTALLFALSWYYLLALIVHPWYSITLIFLAVFTRFRFPMVWSFLAVLSYWAYSNPAFQENFWLVGIEYTVVIAFFGWEVFGSKSKNSISISQKSNYL